MRPRSDPCAEADRRGRAGRGTLHHPGGKEYKQKGRTVSTQQWEAWIAKSSVPPDLELLKEMEQEDLISDQATVTERVKNLRETFSQWLVARQALAAALPEVRSTSYDNFTADIHSRMIGKLPLLIPLDIYDSF